MSLVWWSSRIYIGLHLQMLIFAVLRLCSTAYSTIFILENKRQWCQLDCMSLYADIIGDL